MINRNHNVFLISQTLTTQCWAIYTIKHITDLPIESKE